ncbi:MAG: (Fe-S)-binding protein [Archaeoglobaceae archaeon]|nr:(Fe-S)-binding protein [Archaeoglobaceae archaeon]MDW8128680.1 4Fe-4S dicluster domain-containing protein [Archaeoglobaceae archaeon]
MSYEILIQKLGFPGSDKLKKILKYLMDEEGAKVASNLPGSLEEISQKTGIEKERVKEILEDLFAKGVVFPRDFKNREFFRFARDIIQFHDSTLASKHVKDPEFAKLWKEFLDEGGYKKMGELLSGLGVKIWRVIPAYNAIKDLPDVLPQENMKELIKAQEKIAVVPCSCRNLTMLIEDPCDHTDETIWHCIQVGRGAEYVLAKNAGIEISVDEALKLIDKIEEDGLVHTWPNTSKMVDPRITANCNCCGDCCEFFLSARAAKVDIGSFIEKSRYEAFVETEKCNGCQTCIERCHFDAIELYRPEGSKKFKAKVIAEKCFGCGVCVIGCEQNAIKLKAVRPPEFILQ